MIAYICIHNLRLILKNMKIALLFVLTPLFLIFILGHTLDQVFAQDPHAPRAIDYFGRNFLGIALMYGSLLSGWVVSKERTSRTNARITVSPPGLLVSLGGLFAGGWAGIFLLTGFTAAAGNLLFGMEIGGRVPIQVLLLAAGSFFTAALGVLFAVLIEEDNASLGVLSGIMPVFIFLGGGYIPIPREGTLGIVSAFSPLRWIFDSISAPPGTAPIWETLAVLVLPGLVFIFCSIMVMRKRGRL